MTRGRAIATLALTLLIANCSSCKDEVIQREYVGPTEISVIRRVCGSASGYHVSIKPRGLDTAGIADQYEPFMMTCDCYASSAAAPVAFTVRGSTVTVRFDRSKAWEIARQRDRQESFTVRYEPYGDDGSPHGSPGSTQRTPHAP